MSRYMNLHQAIASSLLNLKINGKEELTANWQGMEVLGTKKQTMWELTHVRIESPMPHHLSTLAMLVKPNLPWADKHFAERISGIPTNPGEAYKTWPYYPHGKDDKIKPQKFTHTYQERFWPKYNEEGVKNPCGIRFEMGDFDDMVNLLKKDPSTRQAFLPIWFPEDTGAVHGGRVPCSIGYHFLVRDGQLHVEYHIRACDAIRHFRDDVYFAVRLAMEVIDRANLKVKPGYLIMNIGSFHVFYGEQNIL